MRSTARRYCLRVISPRINCSTITPSKLDGRSAEAGDIDTAKTILRTGSGKICVISNSRRSGYGYDQRIEAFCSNGVLRARNLLESSVETWTERGSQSDSLMNFFLHRYREAYFREMEHFADIMRGTARPLVGYSDGLAAMALAQSALESSAKGGM